MLDKLGDSVIWGFSFIGSWLLKIPTMIVSQFQKLFNFLIITPSAGEVTYVENRTEVVNNKVNGLDDLLKRQTKTLEQLLAEYQIPVKPQPTKDLIPEGMVELQTIGVKYIAHSSISAEKHQNILIDMARQIGIELYQKGYMKLVQQSNAITGKEEYIMSTKILKQPIDN